MPEAEHGGGRKGHDGPDPDDAEYRLPALDNTVDHLKGAEEGAVLQPPDTGHDQKPKREQQARDQAGSERGKEEETIEDVMCEHEIDLVKIVACETDQLPSVPCVGSGESTGEVGLLEEAAEVARRATKSALYAVCQAGVAPVEHFIEEVINELHHVVR